MGRIIKNISDPQLAKSHQKGANVMVVQQCLHNKFGEIIFKWPRYWVLHYRYATNAFQRLQKYEKEILKLPVGKTNNRQIYDIKLIRKIYKAGFDLVANTYLTFEHLSLEILCGVYSRSNPDLLKNLEKKELKEKISFIITDILHEDSMIKDSGYVKLFSEYENIRHAFNHPVSMNVYNSSNDWDKVPLAWIISCKYQNGYIEIDKFLEKFVNKWGKVKSQYDKPVTLNIQRGIKSTHQFKKSPK